MNDIEQIISQLEVLIGQLDDIELTGADYIDTHIITARNRVSECLIYLARGRTESQTRRFLDISKIDNKGLKGLTAQGIVEVMQYHTQFEQESRNKLRALGIGENEINQRIQQGRERVVNEPIHKGTFLGRSERE